MTSGISVVIPSITPRADMLVRAVESVAHQLLPADAIIVEVDNGRTGAPDTRQRGLEKVTTEWVAFLDDDDLMDPHHLATLLATAKEYGADYVWSRFRIGYPDGTVVDGPSPLSQATFEQFDPDNPAQTTVTTLVRTRLALEVGGFAAFEDSQRHIDGQRIGEDFDFTMRMHKAGAVFRHAPVVTWTWSHWGVGGPGVPGNTSGSASRW
jgi:glycosyltransferase involved in cell wall biosynthesis